MAAQSGLNYHFPYPIETVSTPKVTEVKRIEIGFRTVGKNQYQTISRESLMLTGDENIVDAEMIVQYRKKKRYFRKGSDPDVIARLVKKILLSNKPKARYSVGIDAKLSLLLNSLLPNSLFDYLVSRATIGR